MSKQINPYLDFVLGLDATQFDLLCDSINQRKDRERYGATSFEEAALYYGRKPICPKCLSDKYHEDGYTPSLAKRYRCENCDCTGISTSSAADSALMGSIPKEGGQSIKIKS